MDKANNPGIDEETGEHEARLIDELVQPKSPLEPAELPKESAPPAPVLVSPGPNRLMTKRETIADGWAPIKVMNADPLREELHLYAVSDTAIDFVYFASDSSAIDGMGAALYSGQHLILSDFTGEVWIAFPSSGVTGPVTVNAVAVTR